MPIPRLSMDFSYMQLLRFLFSSSSVIPMLSINSVIPMLSFIYVLNCLSYPVGILDFCLTHSLAKISS